MTDGAFGISSTKNLTSSKTPQVQLEFALGDFDGTALAQAEDINKAHDELENSKTIAPPGNTILKGANGQTLTINAGNCIFVPRTGAVAIHGTYELCDSNADVAVEASVFTAGSKHELELVLETNQTKRVRATVDTVALTCFVPWSV